MQLKFRPNLHQGETSESGCSKGVAKAVAMREEVKEQEQEALEADENDEKVLEGESRTYCT